MVIIYFMVALVKLTHGHGLVFFTQRRQGLLPRLQTLCKIHARSTEICYMFYFIDTIQQTASLFDFYP